jgi:hypothetical protein
MSISDINQRVKDLESLKEELEGLSLEELWQHFILARTEYDKAKDGLQALKEQAGAIVKDQNIFTSFPQGVEQLEKVLNNDMSMRNQIAVLKSYESLDNNKNQSFWPRFNEVLKLEFEKNTKGPLKKHVYAHQSKLNELKSHFEKAPNNDPSTPEYKLYESYDKSIRDAKTTLNLDSNFPTGPVFISA